MPDSPNGNGTARWQLIVSVAAILVAVGGALLTLLLNINSISNSVTSLQGDRDRLYSRVSVLETQNATLGATVAGMARDFVELESQFCAEDAVRNLTHAHDLRDMGVLWKRVLGDELPLSNAYYPAIGRCGIAPGK